jgi:DNA-directed RNA polymerase specialized sigma24 family protein
LTSDDGKTILPILGDAPNGGEATLFPSGVCEADFITAVTDVVRQLSHKYSFGIYSEDDLLQEGYEWALRAIHKYDARRTRLFNFLYSHIRNRLFNLRRDKLERLTPPCSRCPLNAFVNNVCTLYSDDLEECTHYSKWITRNNAKRSLMTSTQLDEPSNGETKSPLEVLATRERISELRELLDDEADLRVFDAILANEKVPRATFDRLIAKLKEMISDE